MNPRDRVAATIRRAVESDAVSLSRLLLDNHVSQGGTLLGDWREPEIAGRIARGDLILLAHQDGELVGALVTEEKRFATAPPVQAMLQAWPGGDRSFVYGPVCIASSARGRGLLLQLNEALRQQRPDQTGVLFIRSSNPASLRAHLKLGMRRVAGFEMQGDRFDVLTTAGSDDDPSPDMGTG